MGILKHYVYIIVIKKHIRFVEHSDTYSLSVGALCLWHTRTLPRTLWLQIMTSVRRRTLVTFMPRAPTARERTTANATMATREMDTPVKVSQQTTFWRLKFTVSVLSIQNLFCGILDSLLYSCIFYLWLDVMVIDT